MGLGRREARHQTVASTKVAVDSTLWWDFKPGQSVMTVDGFPGVVTAVQDGPHAGNEAYEVTLDNGMGGGLYTSSQLSARDAATASVEHTAADDYPELGSILQDRPDIAPNSVVASKQAHLTEGDEHHDYPEASFGHCDICGSGGHSSDLHQDEPQPEDGFVHETYGDHHVSLDGKHIGQYPTREHAEHALHHAMDKAGYYPNTWHTTERGDAEQHGEDFNDRFNKHFPNTGADGMRGKGHIGGDFGHAVHAPMDEWTPKAEVHQHLQEHHGFSDHDIETAKTWGNEHQDHDDSHDEGACDEPGCDWNAHGHVHAKRPVDMDDFESHFNKQMGPQSPHALDLLHGGEIGPTKFSSLDEARAVAAIMQRLSWDKSEWDENDDPARCGICGSSKGDHTESDHPAAEYEAWNKTSAFDHGDPNAYTAPHACPNCGSKTALESVSGLIKCEMCGHEATNQADGWPHEGSLNDFLDMHIRPRKPLPPASVQDRSQMHPSTCDGCGFQHWSSASNPNCMLCGGHTSQVADDQKYASAQPIVHKDTMGATCKECGFGHYDKKPGDACPLCGGQMSKHPDKYAALLEDPSRMLLVAAVDPDFRWHVTASWSDVRAKGKRIRAEGKVNIISVTGSTCVANVKGDHGVYETEIVSVPGTKSVGTWHCGCKWSAYSWGRSGPWKRYEGRMCSHAFALHLEMQSQGMFGRTIEEDQKAPQWLRPRTRVVTEYDRDEGKNVSRPAQPRKRDVGRTFSTLEPIEASAAVTYLTEALQQGVEAAEVHLALRAAGISLHAEKEEDGDEDPTGPCAHCGHSVSMHHHFGACSAVGCDCRGYKEKGEKEARKKKHHPDARPSSHGYGPAWAYGLGYWGLCGQCAGGGCGACGGTGQDASAGTAATTGSDGGSGAGDGGGGMSSTGMAYNEDPASDHPEVADAPSVPLTQQPQENPASTGWASQADPKEFDQAGAMNALGSMDESMFDPDEMTALADLVSVATLDEEPEAALPSTDGGDGSSPGGDEGETPLASMSSISEPRTEPEKDLLLAQSADQIVAAFQAQASHLQGAGGEAGQATSDIAAQAAAFLATGQIPGAPGGMQTTAMKVFSPEEQRQIISEGADQLASNFDRLDIAGTHYEALEASLASVEAEATDDDWMMT